MEVKLDQFLLMHERHPRKCFLSPPSFPPRSKKRWKWGAAAAAGRVATAAASPRVSQDIPTSTLLKKQSELIGFRKPRLQSREIVFAWMVINFFFLLLSFFARVGVTQQHLANLQWVWSQKADDQTAALFLLNQSYNVVRYFTSK